MADEFKDIAAAPRPLNPGNKSFLGGASQGQIMDNNGNMFLFSGPKQLVDGLQPLNLQNDASSIYILANEFSSSLAENGSIPIPYSSTNFTSKNGQTIQTQSQFVVPETSSDWTFDEVSTDEVGWDWDTEEQKEISLQESIKKAEQRKIEEKVIEEDFIEDFLPESDEDEFFNLSTDIEGIEVPLPNKIDVEILEEESPTTSSSTSSSSGKTTNRKNQSNSSWDGKEVPRKVTALTAQQAGDAIKKTTSNKNLQIMALAVMFIEQGYGDGIKASNNNFAGVDITNGGWKYDPATMDGYVWLTEGGTGRKKQFASFKTPESSIKFKIDVFKRKGFDTIDLDKKYYSITNHKVWKVGGTEKYTINANGAAYNYMLEWNGFGCLDFLYSNSPFTASQTFQEKFGPYDFEGRQKVINWALGNFESKVRKAKKALGYS